MLGVEEVFACNTNTSEIEVYINICPKHPTLAYLLGYQMKLMDTLVSTLSLSWVRLWRPNLVAERSCHRGKGGISKSDCFHSPPNDQEIQVYWHMIAKSRLHAGPLLGGLAPPHSRLEFKLHDPQLTACNHQRYKSETRSTL